ncbi:hypothetical protein [Pseudomonas sp. LB3P31]
MAKPPIKIKIPAADTSGTIPRPGSEGIQPPGGQGTVNLPDVNLPGTDRTPGTTASKGTPDNNSPVDPVVVVTDHPVVARSTPELPEDTRLFDPAMDGELTFAGKPGILRSTTGTLFARLEHIGDVAIQINSNGQYEISTATQHRMVLEQIEDKPLWRRKISRPDSLSRGEPVSGSDQPLPLDRLFIPIPSAKRLTAPDVDGFRRDIHGRRYVYLENSRTVMVVPIDGGKFQATLASVLTPTGPILERVGLTAVWRIEQDGPGPSKRPRIEEPDDLLPVPLEPATVWNGRWQPNREAIQPFALRHSRHAAKFRWDSMSWTSLNPLYPFTAGRGQRKDYISLLAQGPATLKAEPSAANIKQRVEAFTQWGLKIDLHALRFFRVPGQVSTEVLDINGGLIGDLINRKKNGQPAIQRIIEPMAGSGFYSNYARAVGFEGHLIINDINPLFAWTQKEIIRQPDKVNLYINDIKNDLIELASQYNIELDRRALSLKLASPQASKEYVKSENVKNFRDAVRNYFNEVVDVVVEVKDGHIAISHPAPERPSVIVRAQGDRIIVSSPPDSDNGKAFLAAVVYIAQHNTSRNFGIIEIRQLINGAYSLNFPIAMMMTEGPIVKLFKSGLLNNGHINFVSYLHTNAKQPTQILNEDGWHLLDTLRDTDSETNNKGDLIILSGHFSDTYLAEPDFFKKITEHVVPLSEKGASVIITNSYSQYKETSYSTLGFYTFKKTRDGNDKAMGDYLLALNGHAMQAALDATP